MKRRNPPKVRKKARKNAKPVVREVLRPLMSSARGRIFVCNLISAAKKPKPLVDTPKLRVVMDMAIKESELLGKEEQLMASLHYKTIAFKQRIASHQGFAGVPEEFSQREKLISVISVEDYFRHYAKTTEGLRGFSFRRPAPVLAAGWRSTYFHPTAMTRFPFWVAPMRSLPKPPSSDDAEGIRDALGLVHRGKKKALIAMVLTPPAKHRCYRPTVLEAMPNARFLQRHPHMKEDRWGFTVNLAKLGRIIETGEPAHVKKISGLPEMILDPLMLSDCTNVEFISLGRTETDRATESADIKFSEILEEGREAGQILKQLSSVIGQGTAK